MELFSYFHEIRGGERGMDPRTVRHIRKIINDQDRLAGHVFSILSEQTGQPVEQVAWCMAAVLSVFLSTGDQARTLCNSLLLMYMMIVLSFYPKERPSRDLVIVYWAVFGITTGMDLSLERDIPLYYLVKVILHMLLFIQPYSLAEKILEVARGPEHESLTRDNGSDRGAHKKEESSSDGPEKIFSKAELKILLDPKKKSPPPEKPESERRKNESPLREDSSSWPTSSNFSSIKSGETITGAEVTARAETPSGLSNENVPQVSDPPAAAPAPEVPSLAPDSAPSAPERTETTQPSTTMTPMNYDFSSATTSPASAPSPGVETKGAEVGVGKYDLRFFPTKHLVFNGPFDTGLTYMMNIINESVHNVAFAVKTNALGRVKVDPPSGVILSKKKMVLAVTLERMEQFEPSLCAKDRVSFEYVRCKEEKFSFKLLQHASMKCRKNIYIQYNP